MKPLFALPEAASRRGDLFYEVALGPDELPEGGRYRVTIRRPGRCEKLLVRVPPGVRIGTRLRLRGKARGSREPTGRPAISS